MVRERRYYVYIMASKGRVLYVGVTGFLMARLLRHKAGGGGAFTRKYRVHRLAYYHSFQKVGDAIARGLAHLCTTTTEAAPPFAIFEGWEPRTSTLDFALSHPTRNRPFRNLQIKVKFIGLGGLSCAHV